MIKHKSLYGDKTKLCCIFFLLFEGGIGGASTRFGHRRGALSAGLVDGVSGVITPMKCVAAH